MSDVDRYLPLTPLTLHILLALLDGPAHGYAIGSTIETASDGRVSPTTGSLYQALKRLRDESLLSEAPAPEGQRSSGPPRLYFELTPLGRRVALAEARRLDHLLDVVRAAGMMSARPVTGR